MSNRLYAKDKQYAEVPFRFDTLTEQQTILRRAEALRADAVARMVKAVVTEIRTAFAEFGTSVARARTAHELAALDDRMLADIGINRSDIPGYVAGQIDFARQVIAEDRSKRQKVREAA